MAEQEAWKDQSESQTDQQTLDALTRELDELRDKRNRLGDEIIALTKQSAVVRDAIEILRARMRTA